MTFAVSERDPLLLVGPKLFSVALELAAELPKGVVGMVLVIWIRNQAKIVGASATKDGTTKEIVAKQVVLKIVLQSVGIAMNLGCALLPRQHRVVVQIHLRLCHRTL